MFENQLFNGIIGKGFDLLGGSDTPNGGQEKRYEKIKTFLLKQNFNGFTKDDLFIMQFINKGWGHDIAALSKFIGSSRATNAGNSSKT